MTTLKTKTVTGTHSLTGEALAYTVAAVHNPDSDLTDGGCWMVTLNGKPIRWYGMERPAVRCVERARVGAYGISFGEAF